MGEMVASLTRNPTMTQPARMRIRARQPRSAALIGWRRGSTTSGIPQGHQPPCCLRWLPCRCCPGRSGRIWLTWTPSRWAHPYAWVCTYAPVLPVLPGVLPVLPGVHGESLEA